MADEKLKARLGLDNSEFKRGLKDSESQLSKMSAGFRRLGAVIGAAFSVNAIANFAGEGIKLAASLEGVEQAFKKLNQPNLLQDLQRATRGTVSDLQLMQKAVQAKNFKIPLEQLATYFEFATKRAIQTGESVDYLVDSIITGIGRKSVLVMDNLGISAVALQEEVKKVGDFGTAAGNIIQRELTDMGEMTDTAATSIARLSNAWKELKTQVGQFILNSGLTELLEALTKDFVPVNDPFEKWRGLDKATAEARKEEVLGQIEYYKSLGDAGKASLGFWTDALEVLDGIIGKTDTANIAVEKQVDTIASLNAQLEEEKEWLEQIDVADKKALTTQLQVIDALEKRIKSLTTLREVNPMIGGVETPDNLSSSWAKISTGADEAWDKLAKGPGFTQPIEDMTDALMLQGEAINILTNSFDTLFTSAEDGFANMVDTMIDGMKRLVAEYLAKAVIFGLIRALFPASGLATMATQNLWNMGLGGKATGGLGGFQSQPLNVNVVGSIRGKDIALALRRNG